MTDEPTIKGKLDRVTGRPATIFTPPEDLVEPTIKKPISDGFDEQLDALAAEMSERGWGMPEDVRARLLAVLRETPRPNLWARAMGAK